MDNILVMQSDNISSTLLNNEDKTPVQKRYVISITESAAQKIKELLKSREIESIGIRISVKSGGCSGFSYDVEYADNIRPFEERIDLHGVTVLVDPKAIIFLIGSEMDYFEDKFKSGFVFNNPNEKGKCGCGKSFSV